MEWILFTAAAICAVIPLFLRKEEAPEDKITSTGVVEKLIGEGTKAEYVVRFTGQQNRSYLARTVLYSGPVDKYPVGKLVHIRYWFGKKGQAGLEIIDPELTPIPKKAVKTAPFYLAAGLFFLAGLALLLF